jgi:predicted house-cleaning NTP pyrophosphatase (Maf/HAM1 superfamily)
VVVMDGHIHGKPSSHEDAFSMLQKWVRKGNIHTVAETWF